MADDAVPIDLEAAAAAAQKAFDDAEAERKRVLAEKKAIEDEISSQKI